jgi:protein-S-isoprenylcysteine O-methyltransferase Ste14
MSSLELKIPPPIVALCFALFMWLASKLVPPVQSPFGLRRGVAIVLVAAGLAVSVAGVVSFRRARTTINPTRPTAASALVSTGAYRFTRNPMYVGLALCLLAWAAFLSNVVALLLVPLFVSYINRFQIIPEERALLELFGARYTAYKVMVRRWL